MGVDAAIMEVAFVLYGGAKGVGGLEMMGN
jgi:hypothetical protein